MSFDPRPRLSLTERLAPPIAFIVIILGLTAGLCASEGRWVLAEVTAYAGNCPHCETTGVTANGTNVSDVPYGVASSPNLPFQSRIYIPSGAGYLDVSRDDDRWFTVDDRGGALRTEWRRSGVTRLDLRYRSHASAKQFGRKLILVFITTN